MKYLRGEFHPRAQPNFSIGKPSPWVTTINSYLQTYWPGKRELDLEIRLMREMIERKIREEEIK